MFDNLKMDPEDALDWQANLVVIDTLLEQIGSINQALMTNLSASEKSALRALRADLLENLEQTDSMNILLFGQYLTDAADLIDGYESDNNSITTDADNDANEKLLNAIWLQTGALNQTPSANQQQTIEAIATQCLETGGQAVLWARTWYYTLTGQLIELEEDCNEERNSIKVESADIFLKASPNPARDYLLLYPSEGVFGQAVRITLFDITGRVVLEQEAPAGTAYIYLQTGKLPTGVYQLRVAEQGQPVKTVKAVLQH